MARKCHGRGYANEGVVIKISFNKIGKIMFKNAIVYKILNAPEITNSFEDLLIDNATRKPYELELKTTGWSPVLGGQLLAKASQGLFVRMTINEKILPASVINDELATRIEAIENEQGFKVSKTVKNSIKDQVITDFAKVALVKSSKITGFIGKDYLVVDTSAPAKADDFTSLLRKTIGKLAIEPIGAGHAVNLILSNWAKSQHNVPEFLTRTGSYALKSEEDLKQVKLHGFVDGEQFGAEEYAMAGDIVTEMSLCYDEKIEFTLTDKFVFKKIQYLIEDDNDADNEYTFRMSEFELTAGELNDLIAVMIDVFDV